MNIQKRNIVDDWGIQIGVDVDETIFPNLPIFVEWHNRHYGTQATLVNFAEYGGWNEVFGISVEVVVERFMEFMYGYYYDLSPEPFPGAENTLVGLKDDGVGLNIVSSRQSELLSLTNRQVDRAFSDQRLFTGFSLGNKYSRDSNNRGFHEKWQICKLMHIRLMIDDRVSEAESLTAHGVEVILFNRNDQYPWSVTEHSNDRIHMASTWHQIRPLATNLIQKLY